MNTKHTTDIRNQIKDGAKKEKEDKRKPRTNAESKCAREEQMDKRENRSRQRTEKRKGETDNKGNVHVP